MPCHSTHGLQSRSFFGLPYRILNMVIRPLSSSLLKLPYRILNINHKKELLWGLWVALTPTKPSLAAFLASWSARSVPERIKEPRVSWHRAGLGFRDSIVWLKTGRTNHQRLRRQQTSMSLMPTSLSKPRQHRSRSCA